MVLILPLFLINSCRDEADMNWTNQGPSFKLYNTTLSSNTLYPTMANNSFRLTWDATSAGAPYTVQFSSTSDFASPKVLGTSTTSSYTTTIGALNTALLQAGYSPYSQNMVYLRVLSGTSLSNAISVGITPYPESAPVITSPTAGQVFVLDKNNPDTVVNNVTWTDYSNYGVPVNYLIEVSPKDANNWTSAGSVTSLKTLAWTNKSLNDALTKLGLVPNVAADVDVRVTATTTSTGGTIKKVSNIVTIKVTPYVSFKNLYLVGDATAAGWSNNNNNQPLFRDPSTPSKFYFTGYFNAGSFKLLEVLGQWQPQWGLNGGVVAVNDGTGSDPGVFPVSAPGYYTFTIDIVAKTYSFVPYTGATDVYYDPIGIIGDATPNGWGGDTVMERSIFDPHLWSIKNQALVNGFMKFRANGSWSINWGADTTLSGLGTQDGPNIPVDAATYDIYFNDLDGRYQLIKK